MILHACILKDSPYINTPSFCFFPFYHFLFKTMSRASDVSFSTTATFDSVSLLMRRSGVWQLHLPSPLSLGWSCVSISYTFYSRWKGRKKKTQVPFFSDSCYFCCRPAGKVMPESVLRYYDNGGLQYTLLLLRRAVISHIVKLTFNLKLELISNFYSRLFYFYST